MSGRGDEQARFQTVPRVAIGTLAALLLLQIGVSLLINLWLFPSRLLHPIARGSLGLIDPTLSANLLAMLVVLGSVLLFTRLRPADLGLSPRGAGAALALGAATWASVQLPSFFAAADAERTLGPAWRDGNATWTLGSLLAQLVGNALYEEAFFRGFLLVQVALLFGATAAPVRRGLRWARAIGVSQLVFAATHVPNRIAFQMHTTAGEWAADMAGLFAAGVVFALIYVGFGNLWLAVVLHALLNRPTPLCDAGDMVPRAVVAGVTLLVTIAAVVRLWRRARRQLGRGG